MAETYAVFDCRPSFSRALSMLVEQEVVCKTGYVLTENNKS